MAAELQTAGLIERTGRGTLAPGPVSLDSIAERHHTDQIREDRIAHYRRERIAWREWLTEREQQRATPTPDSTTEPALVATMSEETDEHEQLWWESVLANGPPTEHDPEHEALELLADLLGARILTEAQP